MSHIRVLICRVDDPASDQMTELAAFDLPATDVACRGYLLHPAVFQRENVSGWRK